MKGPLPRFLPVVAACCVLLACYSAPTAPSAGSPPTSLASVTVPKGADLSGMRGIDVRIGNLPRAGRLDLLRPDQKIVFTGRADAGQTLRARIVMPTKDSSLTAVLRTPGAPDLSLPLVIEAGLAKASFP